MAGSLRLSGNQFHKKNYRRAGHRKNRATITAEMMARHNETSAGRAKMLSGGDTGDRLAEVDEVLYYR